MKLIKITKFLVGMVLYAVILLLAGILFDVWPTFLEGFFVTIAALSGRDLEEWF